MLMRDPLLSCRGSGLHSPAQQLQPQQDRHAQQERGRVKVTRLIGGSGTVRLTAPYTMA